MHRPIRFLVSLAFFTCVPLVLAQEDEKPALKVGDDAPEATFSGSDGKTYKLSDFEGKSAVVIAWFPKAFTGGCTQECKSLRASGDKIKAYNVAYFTASCDDQETNKKFAESLDLDYVILSDPEGEAAKKFGVYNAERGFPQRKTFYIGKDGKVKAIDDKVNVQEHGDHIAEKLEELGVEKKKG